MPETDDLDHGAAAILFVGDGKVGDHDGVAEQDHFVLACELPLTAFVTKLVVEIGGEIGFHAAVKGPAGLEVADQIHAVIEIVSQPFAKVGHTHGRPHAPTITEKERR